MSAFTAVSVIERLEEEMQQLKTENNTLKQRVAAMTTQMAENRKANKKVLEQRDAQNSQLKAQFLEMCDSLKVANNDYFMLKENLNGIIDAREYEIAEVKKELKKSNSTLDAVKKNWHVANTYTNEVISQRESEVTSLKKQLAEQIEFTEKAIAKASDVENDLFMKNSELTTRIGVIMELSERQSNFIYEMQRKESEFANQHSKLLATEEQLASTKLLLNRANEILTAINSASSYIVEVLSHRK